MNNLISVFNETVKIYNSGNYTVDGKNIDLSLNKEQMRSATVFSDIEINSLIKKHNNYINKNSHAVYKVLNTTSFEAAYELCLKNSEKHSLVLNFANPVHPGGGVYHGARAQEEDLCRKSTLIYSLESENAKEYYDYNRRKHSRLSSNYMIISPNVEVFRNADNTLSDNPFVVSVLTCAAPIMSDEAKNLGNKFYEDLLYQRIKGMLCLALNENYKNLVLGALGCGAFGNDAEVVAKLFKKAFDELGNPFDNVVMAVLDKTKLKYNYRMFNKYFG